MDQRHEITWRDGAVPVSKQFDDPFYSLDNGLDETRHVFLSGNDLPGRFKPGFHIAELGFGTGLNFVAAASAWKDAGINGPLQFTSFEAFPLDADTTRKALAAFQDAMPWGEGVVEALTGNGVWTAESVSLRIIFGDAREQVPAWDGKADAWFLDGFSPAKNPELWDPQLLRAVANHTATGGTCATYSAAGAARRALTAAGFEVNRVPGFGRKRHMSIGRLL